MMLPFDKNKMDIALGQELSKINWSLKASSINKSAGFDIYTAECQCGDKVKFGAIHAVDVDDHCYGDSARRVALMLDLEQKYGSKINEPLATILNAKSW